MRWSPLSYHALFMTLLALMFLGVPLVVVVLFSFHSADRLSLPFEGLSLRWYREILQDGALRESVGTSLTIAVAVTVVVMMGSTAAAYGVSRSSRRVEVIIVAVLLLPLLLPGLLLGVGLLSLFAQQGIPLSSFTVAVAHTVLIGPVVFLLMLTALNRLPESHLEVAADLGASPLYRFRKVIVPQVRPFLVAGAAIAFVMSFDEFVVTFFVAGSEPTLPMLIFSRLRRTIHPSLNAISSMLVFVNIVLWAVGLGYSMRREAQRKRRARLQERRS